MTSHMHDDEEWNQRVSIYFIQLTQFLQVDYWTFSQISAPNLVCCASRRCHSTWQIYLYLAWSINYSSLSSLDKNPCKKLSGWESWKQPWRGGGGWGFPRALRVSDSKQWAHPYAGPGFMHSTVIELWKCRFCEALAQELTGKGSQNYICIRILDWLTMIHTTKRSLVSTSRLV